MKQIGAIFLFLLLGLSVFAQNDDDNNISSNFIIDLIHKVEWPAGSNLDSFVINVVGDDKMVPALKSVAQSKSNKKVIINSLSLNDNFEQCQILFIATDSLSHLAKILKRVENKPILTVSNQGTFARYGVMINIRDVKNNKIKYAVNNMTARKAKLKISDDLLKKAVETFG